MILILIIARGVAGGANTKCVNRCGFCGVPKIEGQFRELEDWPDRPVICDNNLLAASTQHFDRVIEYSYFGKKISGGFMKVYQYGVTNMPAKLPEHIFHQFWLQNQFWNALVELENKFQEHYNNLVADSDLRLQVLEEEINNRDSEKKELREWIKRERQKARGEITTEKIAEKNARIKDINAKLATLKQERRAIRQAAREKIKPHVDQLNDKRKAEAKALRQQYAAEGLYWSNYNAVAASYQVARKTILPKRTLGLPARMNFHRFNGEGRLTVQLQGGLAVSDLFAGENQYIHIKPVPEEAWSHPARGQRRRLAKTTGQIRVGSDGRKPIWFDFNVTLHRPLPQDGRIKFVQLNRKKIGTNWRWQLNITVDEKPPAPANLPSKTVAIDLGWRKTDDGLRVAVWRDEDNHKGEVQLDTSYLRVNTRLTGLQATIAKNFNAIKDNLAVWRQQNSLPDWMHEEMQHILQWRSPRRLVGLINRIQHEEVPPPPIIREALETWRTRHLHLYDWQSNLRDKLQGRRREQFRLFAKWLAESYNTIVIEEFDISQVVRKKKPELGVDHAHAARHWAKIAAPGELRQEIERCGNKTGAAIARIDAKRTTTTCPFCENIVNTDTSKSIEVTCDHCGLTYDQDYGATKNILKRQKENLSQT